MIDLRNVRRDYWLLLLIVVLGALLRLDFLTQSIIDADEAIVGLMAKHIAEGRTPPIFYYGQHYMGSFEALIAAAVFKIFGISTGALKFVPYIFSVLLIPLVYLIGNTIGGRLAGQVAAFCLAVAPTSLVLWSSKARGGFAELIFLGALAVVLATQWFAAERPRLSLSFVIWFLLGLGWWVNNQVIFFICPMALLGGIYLVSSKMRNRRDGPSIISHSFVTIVAFLLGSLPYWIYNFQHKFASLKMFKDSRSVDYLSHVSGLFSEALPMIFGAHRFWSVDPIFWGATPLAYILYGVPLLWALASLLPSKNKRHPERIWTLRLITLLFFSVISIFVMSSFGHLTQAPRYLLPLYVPMMVLVGAFVAAVYRYAPFISYLWLTLLITLNSASLYLGERGIEGEPHVFDGERVAKDHSELLAWCEQNKIDYVRTNYWIGYRLAFESEERVKFVMFREPHQVRIREYERVKTPELLPLVLTPKQGVIVANALRVLRVEHKTTTLSGYTVLYDLKPEPALGPIISANKLRLAASENNETASGAIDGNNNTRWGTAKAQSLGMSFKLRPVVPTYLQTVTYDLGLWPHDFPRALEASITLPNGTKEKIFTAQDYADLRYYLTDPRIFRFSIAQTKIIELELSLAGEDPVFDWTIAELGLYEGVLNVEPQLSKKVPTVHKSKPTTPVGLGGDAKK